MGVGSQSGALPEDDPSGDALAAVFQGDPIYWNRKIDSVEVVPTPGVGASFFDVFFEIDVEANYDGRLRLASQVELQVNGVPMGSLPVIFDDLIFNPCKPECDIVCVVSAAAGDLGVCREDDDGPLPCSCQLAPVGLTFEAVPATPGDEITVILRPAPGALPELPGFEEDDMRTEPVPDPCPWDLDADGVVGIGDLLALFSLWGPCPGPPGCPGDFNGDGFVGVGDMLSMFANWGPCR